MGCLTHFGPQLLKLLGQGDPSSATESLLGAGAGDDSEFDGVADAGAGGAGHFPVGVMDGFLVTAGYSLSSPLMQLFLFVYRQLGARLGFDPYVVLTVLGLLWGASRLFSQVWGYVWDLLDRHFTCAMYVSQYDHIYPQLMKWLSLQQSIKSSRYLMAQTVWKSAWDEEEDLENSLFWTDGDDGDGGGNGECKYLNFSNQAARSGPRYVPAMGITGFWHKGTYFRVTRRKESLMSTSGWGAMKDLEEIKISCLGRSIKPIKNLLSDAKTAYYFDTYRKTTIYRPRPKEMRRENGMWHQVARRPIRPMRTVVLDGQEKHNVLADVNEYLHPATPRWYASRGIPLRRGYLFHGPPGTGKTSFSFALAGVFGIDIYVISLQDVNVTEEDLAVLFTNLPGRCIVLLEDIDTAGLRRDDDEEDFDAENKEKDKEGEAEKALSQTKALTNSVNGDHKVKEASKKNGKKEKAKKQAIHKKVVASDSSDASDNDDSSDMSESESESDKPASRRRSKKRSERRDRRKSSSSGRKVVALESISLSGLLNAIDGVASHEGRVLIMTTNKPESLDEALIRPGRVDVQVAFMNASSEQAAELFYRMYEASRPRQRVLLGSWSASQEEQKREKKKNKSHEQQQHQKRHQDEQKTEKEKVNQNIEQPGTAEATTATTTSTPAELRPTVEAMLLQLHEGLDVSEEELKAIAKEFGRRIPTGTFSPAEIQGFLLKRKKSPRKALADVEGWVEATVKQKEANSKVSTVQ
ncbi:hypothetical protein Purlil1_11484 [Purpureocillium lilacinum]|uniref:Mitochondrial chaperone bcs1 n=1 Tax=Purpureocillium lilacinum TaxID=33203 RepID=A0ABR0BKL5_PURLI|nr:hypothetical protein Purlil1_11484 [Purpureocillium lilacinum]